MIKKFLFKMIDLGLFNLLPTKLFLKFEYFLRTNKKLNLDNPKTYNEKLQWLKLYDKKSMYTYMVDKYDVKKYVANIIGDEYIIPTLGVYNRITEIDFDKLPDKFVIKCTHDSGGIFICKDKSKLDRVKLENKLKKHLKKNYYYSGREWPYKNLKPRIIIEKYMEDDKQTSIRDYKFFCFNGNVKYMYVSEGLEDHSTASMCFFDMNYNIADIQRRDYQNFKIIPEKPKNFEKMKELSSILSIGIPHLRVDWYEINGKLYFGELTFFTCSGYIPFLTDDMDYKLGNFIDLSVVKQNEK